ncbi:MAG: hypothetical protein AB8D78_10095 [Akkermansiaceae bacterium]
MNKTNALLCGGVLAALGLQSHAGDFMTPVTPEPEANDPFATVRRPISNPTLFDLALPSTNIHPIFVYHNLPDTMNTTLGNIPVGGDVQVYALQFEYAFTERLSLVATKDGFIDFNPGGGVLQDASGFANLGAGLKYAFIYDPVNEFVLSGSAVLELPTGNDDVLQGQGDGVLNLIVSGLKMWDNWQWAGAAGARIAFSDEQSSSTFVSSHISYEVTPWFIPLAEVNWHHVIDAGNGTQAFNRQAGGAVPAVANFEGSDFFNFGAANAGGTDLITVALGFRSRIADGISIGAAYEIPLTDDSTSVIDDRITLDAVWRF